MGNAIFQGILWGLTLSIFIGPVFFYLIETSLSKGVKAALFADLGVLVSDVTYLLLAYAFTSEIEAMRSEQATAKVVGGVIFMIFGLAAFLKKGSTQRKRPKSTPIYTGKNYLLDIVKGFVLNAINPSVLFYWVGVVAYAVAELGTDAGLILVFFIALLTTFFSLDVLKIVGARKLKPFITPKVMLRINQLTGVILFGFGMLMAIQGGFFPVE